MKIGIDSRGVNLYSGSGIGTYTKNLIINMINNNTKDTFNLIWTGKKNEKGRYRPIPHPTKWHRLPF